MSEDDPLDPTRKRPRGRPTLDELWLDEYGPLEFLPSGHPMRHHVPTPLDQVRWDPIPETVPRASSPPMPAIEEEEFHATTFGKRHRIGLVLLAIEADRRRRESSGRRLSRSRACQNVVSEALKDGRLSKAVDFESTWRTLYDILRRWEARR